MSSILKALKKLDSEERSAGLDPSVAERDIHVAKPFSRLVLLALLAGLVVGGALGALLLINSQPPEVSPPDATVIEAPAVPSAPVAAGPSGTVAPPTLIDDSGSETLSESATTRTSSAVHRDVYLPVLQQPVKSTVVTEPQAAVEPSSQSPETDKVVAETTLVEERVESVDIPRPGFERTQRVTKPDLPFVVSEIFYEKGSSANMAVVNDLPAMEGTLVDGVFLKTIEVDRVIFEVDGQEVEVLLQQTIE